MRIALAAMGLAAMALGACAPIAVNSMDHATRALEPRAELNETIQRYLSNIQYGQIDEAAESVEPALQGRFKTQARKLRDIRFTDSRVESLTFAPDRKSAEAVVVYRGYWLASPYEREIQVVKHWRQEKTFVWVVAPDLDAVVAGPGSSQPPAAPAL
jgi:hypothetical protein